jgi:hypothetical protein
MEAHEHSSCPVAGDNPAMGLAEIIELLAPLLHAWGAEVVATRDVAGNRRTLGGG